MILFSLNKRRSFALVELLTVMGIIAILFSLTVPQLFRLRDRSNLQAATTKVISIIRQQQLNAMNNAPQIYGLYFQNTQYTQFKGAEYISTDEANIITLLDYPIELSSIDIPNSIVLFASGSGEVVNYNSDSSSLVLEDMTHHEINTISLNSLGVPTSQ